MSPRVRSSIVAALAGALFAAGLALSGMTVPAKVTGFLDVFGHWDPSLAFVMVGAIATHFVLRRLVLRRGRPVAAASFQEPAGRPVDAPLVIGAAIFGVGWAIGGYCPGPGIVTASSGSLGGLVFVVAMGVGIALHRLVRPSLQTLPDHLSPSANAEASRPATRAAERSSVG